MSNRKVHVSVYMVNGTMQSLRLDEDKETDMNLLKALLRGDKATFVMPIDSPQGYADTIVAESLTFFPANINYIRCVHFTQGKEDVR